MLGTTKKKPVPKRKGPALPRYDGPYTSEHQQADIRLAYDYMMGKGVVRNPTTGKRLLQRAALGPDAKLRGDANCSLGNLYEEGRRKYIKRDRHTALDYFLKAAADGSDYAPHRIRRLEYFPDIYIKLRQEEFAPLPRGTKSPGSVQRADELYAEKKYADALPILLHHAKRGATGAQFTLALMYALGDGVKADKHRCRAWCYLAAKGGLTEAQTALAHELYDDYSIHDTGHEIEPWLKRAARKNDPEAITLLGLLTMSPRNYDQIWNIKLGLSQLERAASLGSSLAMLKLGDYLSGKQKHIHVTLNRNRAKKWYMAAAASSGEEEAAEARAQLRKQFQIKFSGPGKKATSAESHGNGPQKRTAKRTSKKK